MVLTGLATPLGGPAAVLTLVMIVATLRIRPMLIGLALGAASLVWDARLQAVSGMDTTGAWAIIVAVLAVVGAAGVWLGRRREARVERERAAELELRTVQAEERSRIARDLQDTLSHRLSLISLHAGALAYRADLDRDAVTQTTTLLQDQAEAATDDLRQILHVLRDPSGTIDPATSVADLVASARQAGTEVLIDDASLDLARHTDRVSTLAAHTVHRTLQEALTNARKHAPGQPVTLRLREGDGTLVVEAANPDPQPGRGQGHGLIGLAERAGQAGGTLTVTDADPFRLRLEIPWTTR
ncbi:sensor histidine kinase [Corynebacterium suedekumii]|uniref:histidine kinase n=1 Tax=Corynebacterium suedekumii TaxID=3049801 RepID=A0ABY8VMS9_9CORY|nr:histidine kinase [Corynebacterium suedekumii]WIM69484.1 histidine kinase [Corynebacterium suedekumii]